MCPISKFLMSQETFGGFCVVCNYFIFSQNLRNLFSDIFFFPCGNNNLYFDIFFFPCGNNILYLNKDVLLLGTVNLTDKILIFHINFVLVHIIFRIFIQSTIMYLQGAAGFKDYTSEEFHVPTIDSKLVISLNMIP